MDASNKSDTGLCRDPDTKDWSADCWTRDWQTFWAVLISSIILVLTFISIKHKNTQLTDNSLIQIIAIQVVFAAINSLNSKFGNAGYNPALSCGYISFAVSQYAYPNISTDAAFKYKYGFDPSATQVNHYLWVYMIAPFVGGIVAGILHLIHSKCANVKGKDNDVSVTDGEALLE